MIRAAGNGYKSKIIIERSKLEIEVNTITLYDFLVGLHSIFRIDRRTPFPPRTYGGFVRGDNSLEGRQGLG